MSVLANNVLVPLLKEELVKTLLLSIRPKYAAKILTGDKGVELRRTRPNVSAGDLVVVYASSPVKALIGTFQVAEVVTDSPNKLWKTVRHSAGITKKEFDEYYSGASAAFGIVCSNPRTLKEPLDLDQLRDAWGNFWPPQTYRYLKPDEMQRIQQFAPSITRLYD